LLFLVLTAVAARGQQSTPAGWEIGPFSRSAGNPVIVPNPASIFEDSILPGCRRLGGAQHLQSGSRVEQRHG
jgi:hypothetical protein